MLTAALVLFEALRLALRGAALVFSGHFLRLALATLRAGDARSDRESEAGALTAAAPEEPASLPTVLVALPLRDELHVAERIIRRACALEYPREQLQILVLDDSGDATAARVRALVDELAAAGEPIELLHRDEPVGFKAGALQEGFACKDSELIAVFDADNLPPSEFLLRNVSRFADPEVGFVQARWGFANRGATLLTRLQALILDGLFVGEQQARSATRTPLTFNGTAGILRRALIDDVGGFRGEVITEDQDLSYRAALRGWRGVALTEQVVPTELPETMGAFRLQQQRWAFGSGQVLRRLWRSILRSELSWAARLAVLLHLARHVPFVLLLLSCLLVPFTTLYGMPFLIDYGVAPNLGVLLTLLTAMGLHHAVAGHRAGASWGRALGRSLLLTPLVFLLGLGMSLVYTSSLIGGLLSRRGRFVRTPKRGSTDTTSSAACSAATAAPRYRAALPWGALCELAIAGAMGYFALVALDRQVFIYGGFLATVGLAFGWVGLGSLVDRG